MPAKVKKITAARQPAAKRKSVKIIERPIITTANPDRNQMDDNEISLHQAHLWPHIRDYNKSIAQIVGQACPAPAYPLHVSWGLGSPIGDRTNELFVPIIQFIEQHLLAEVAANGVEGDIVEFGVYHGYLLEKLIEKAEELKMDRMIYGFDSFEGLSEPSGKYDYDNWQKGQFAAGYEQVSDYLKLSQRPKLKLIKGWVNETLLGTEAQAIKKIAYARIDVDIYEPSRDCLEYLSTRLSDGAVLVFDDWTFTSGMGETKAFFDWAETVPHLRFEWIGQCSWRFYLRVHHRNQQE